MENKAGGGHRIKIITFVILLVLCMQPHLAVAGETEFLNGLLPSNYKIESGQLSYATDRNTTTYISLGCGPNYPYWVSYTLPSTATITAYQINAYYSGVFWLLDDQQNILFTRNFSNQISKTTVHVENVKYVKVATTMPSGGNYLLLRELYVWGYIPTPPATPTDLNATATHNQAQLTWQANTESDLSGYIIYRDYAEIARVGSESTSYTDSGLQPNTQYTYGIKAYNTLNLISDMSNAATITTLLPPAPTGLTVNNVTPTSANVTWNTVADANSYNIYLDGSPVYNTTQTEYGITGLSPGTNHTVEVRTNISGVESSAGTSTASFTTVPIPAIPTGLSPISATYNEVQLSWDANTEPGLAGYIIYRNYTEIARAGSTSTSFTDSGLKPNTNYSYGIEAYNSFDLFSGMSSIVTVRTLLVPNSLKTPSPSVMANDISASTSMVMYSFGGLLALGLGIKLCPWLITVVKAVFLR